jgi:NAD-dependent dihydropyrimidine dehydrogenase PreA subunit
MTIANLRSEAREVCRDEPGRVAPVIDRNRCEGKQDCVRVCPYDVFEMGSLSASDRSGLSLVGRLKAWAHGNRQAFAVNPGACHACGLCVEACPERAIELVRHVTASGTGTIARRCENSPRYGALSIQFGSSFTKSAIHWYSEMSLTDRV